MERREILCVGQTWVSLFISFKSSVFTMSQIAQCKVTKYEKTCVDTQHVFISFEFAMFGFFAHEIMELLN